MPEPAPRPRGPKLKFSPEDDQLLVDLKENKNLTWKQIAEFFPGRSSGTLQVRYCTKLKAKTTVWTDDTVSFLFCRFNRGGGGISRPWGRKGGNCKTDLGLLLPGLEITQRDSGL